MVRARMLLSRMKGGGPEIFATVQGEGISVGVPSVFVRLAECNLRCTWCDTRYTWDWKQFDKKAETLELSIDDVVTRVLDVAGPSIRRAVLTGGEPLVQDEALSELAAHLRAQGFRLEVETNGTILPSASLANLIDQWNVSPKLSSSGNGERARKRPATLAWFRDTQAATFKFVIASDDDLEEVRQLADELALDASRIVLSPEGTDATTLAARSRTLAEPCQAYGYRLGTRLHVFLWGSERGR
jgi:7-carboxy-7-deazaguanine synthase